MDLLHRSVVTGSKRVIGLKTCEGPADDERRRTQMRNVMMVAVLLAACGDVAGTTGPRPMTYTLDYETTGVVHRCSPEATVTVLDATEQPPLAQFEEPAQHLHARGYIWYDGRFHGNWWTDPGPSSSGGPELVAVLSR